ncbi:hypothetical protein [Winogradskyella sp.]|uniref:hypothetical protein n=1 Tax=Winogradskyella sp. TaxID=1883156 RepID=UPI0026360AF9|nr:hypothetical protein [Winogradskyella sp.]
MTNFRIYHHLIYKLGLILILGILASGCSNERVLQLPEIENADVTEVLDVSPAYIFYDETQPDSTFFNRKNLIGTTNWLVNVDKRLTLRQAIPHIQYLQNKRRKASMHKNENAKNYFTCNDKSIGNLGFIEFTDVDYITNMKSYKNDNPINDIKMVYIHFFDNDVFATDEFFENKHLKNEALEMERHFNFKYFSPYRNSNKKISIRLSFDKRMSFQKYLTIKQSLMYFINRKSVINNEEFIY